jgi:hypothetical protein
MQLSLSLPTGRAALILRLLQDGSELDLGMYALPPPTSDAAHLRTLFRSLGVAFSAPGETKEVRAIRTQREGTERRIKNEHKGEKKDRVLLSVTLATARREGMNGEFAQCSALRTIRWK